MIEYVNQLHEGNVEAYVGIVQGLASDGKSKQASLIPRCEEKFFNPISLTTLLPICVQHT